MSGSFAYMDAFFQHRAITPIPDESNADSATSGEITVRVAVNYLPEQSRVEAGKWFWVYHIRIENHSNEPVKLLTRHWRITDGRGVVQFVDGDGVVGEQPLIVPGASHDYVSGCPLGTPHGSMQGHYTMRKGNAPGREAELFEVAIPFFPLAAPATADDPSHPSQSGGRTGA